MDSPNPRQVLYVDDDEQNLFLFSSLLSSEPYTIHTAVSGRQALEIMAETEIDVLFADQRMPEMSGTQLLELVSHEYPDTIRVLITGYTDVDVVIEAINRGSVYRYISKPWAREEIATTIRNALELRELRSRNQALVTSLDARNRLLEEKVDELGFLNDLLLIHREMNSCDEVIQHTIERLGKELKASAGFWGERRETVHFRLHWPDEEPAREAACRIARILDRRPPELAARAGILRLDAENGSSLPEPIAPGSILILLPLELRDIGFGFLAFLAPEAAGDSGLLFPMAAANMTAASLYSLRLHQEELEKERFLVLGRMAGMIVHDLKGPLSTIKGFARLLGRESLPAGERRECATILQQEAGRLLEMIEELLSYSRGRQYLRLEPVRLRPFIESTLELYRVAFRRAGIEVDVTVGPQEVVPADSKKLKKVLINLLDNARDALAGFEGPRRIAIHAEGRAAETVIRVSNTGPEIPPEVLPRLFDPFFSYARENGTGLGLTICRNIVEEHGGVISACSGPGETAFTIQLPCSAAP